MKKLACAVAVAGLIGTSAFAADMPVKAPAAPAPPVYSWTGWYVGVNAGASMGSANTTFNVSPVTCGFDCGFNLGHSFSDKTYPAGFSGGGQIGYNWQYSPLIVVGFEADFQGGRERDSSNPTNSLRDFSTAEGCCAVTGVTNYTTQIDWFGTVRGRVGYLWGDGAVLTYVTGGLAYGEVKINGTNTIGVSCPSPACIPSATGSFNQPFSQSHVNTGWVLGYGTEGKLLIPGWTYKIETLYMDLGHLSAAGAFSGCPGNLCTVGAPIASQITTNTHFTDWILRAGLNFQFH